MTKETKKGRVNKSRRATGSGQIVRDGASWRAKIEVTVSGTGKRRYKTVKTATQAEAVEALKKMERDLHAGKITAGKGLSLAKFMDVWLNNVKANRAPSTYRNYKLLADNHVIPVLGKKSLDKVTMTNIQAFLNAKALQPVTAKDKHRQTIQTKTLGPATLRNLRAMLHSMYESAIKAGQTATNPVEHCEVPKVKAGKATRAEDKFFTADQTAALLAKCPESDLGDLFAFMLTTGARIGEATGIRWIDLDLGTNPTVSICGQLQRLKGAGLQYRPTTKTNQDRTLPLSKSNADRLRGIKAWQLMSGVKDVEGIVFLNADGKRIDPKHSNNRLRDLCVLAGVPVKSNHKTRHTAATFLLAETNDLNATMKMLGHSQIALTANLYGGANAENLRRPMSVFDKLEPQNDDISSHTTRG